MGIFKATGPEYDKNKPGWGRGVAKEHKFRGLSKREATAIVAKAVGRTTGKAAARAATNIVNYGTGKIMNTRALSAVGGWKAKFNEKRCPGCGKGMPRKGYFCGPCARGMAGEMKPIEQAQRERSLYTLDGQNRNGLVYWPEGHPKAGQRVFPNEYGALDAWLSKHGH